MPNLRIIFMGTPEFAVPSLETLLKNQLNVVAVVTAPDKPKGRGRKFSSSPVKELALNHNLPVLQPTNLKSPEFYKELKSYDANLQVVVAFRMLPEAVWNMPELGTFNLHGSLLPQYRGAAPINWAIINGERETGVTTFFLKHEIDTGDIIFQEKEPIDDNDNAGDVYERLMHKGANLVLTTVNAIQDDDFSEMPQDLTEEVRHAPKIFRETCEINWDQSSYYLYNFIRGLSPHPTAWTILNGKVFKIYKASKTNKTKLELEPGAMDTDNKNYLYIKTADHFLSIDELQVEGKNRMNIKEFFRGNNIS
ncbi:MAG: methionyl-tRNA formyltransferase [Bacteroidota bacterium]|nr:methionyl-tRNA formyltransferase [Bacteroidota bacterium]